MTTLRNAAGRIVAEIVVNLPPCRQEGGSGVLRLGNWSVLSIGLRPFFAAAAKPLSHKRQYPAPQSSLSARG
jgi:hypothetical protein